MLQFFMARLSYTRPIFLPFLQTELLKVLSSELNSLISILRLSTLSKRSSTLATSLSTEHASNLVSPSRSIGTLLLCLCGDVAAVNDLAVLLVGGNDVDGLVLLLGADGLDGFAEGLLVGGDGDADDQTLRLGVVGEVLGDCVGDGLVLGLEECLLLVQVCL
jgi:hypothetical protein